jgi:hypothetical protein
MIISAPAHKPESGWPCNCELVIGIGHEDALRVYELVEDCLTSAFIHVWWDRQGVRAHFEVDDHVYHFNGRDAVIDAVKRALGSPATRSVEIAIDRWASSGARDELVAAIYQPSS